MKNYPKMNFKLLSSLLIKLISKKIMVFPFYHIVSDDKIPHVKYLYRVKNIKEFKNDLDFFLKYFVPISLLELYNFLYNEKEIPSNSLILTFDDGFRECYDIIAPILKEKGITASFFLNTDFIDNRNLFYRCKLSLILDKLESINKKDLELQKNIQEILNTNETLYNLKKELYNIDYNKHYLLNRIAKEIDLDFSEYLKKIKPYLTSKQIQELLSEGFFIGAHSKDHPPFKSLSLYDQIKQTEESIFFLKKKYNIKHSFFAFPFNDENITEKYFNKLKNIVDIFFGTGGFGYDLNISCFQRLPMELPIIHPQKIFLKYYFKYLNKKLFNPKK